MATVRCETAIEAKADAAWALLREFGAADRAFPGILTGCSRDGDARSVTFANGMVVRERLVTLDEAQRRVAYAVIEGRFSQHAASMQIVAEAGGRCRFVWISDFLPAEAEPTVRGLMQQGTEAFRGAVTRSAERDRA